jgi:hypothetical protein
MSFSYARGEISSFVLTAPRPYIACMKNRYPTPQELQVLEHEARRLRALEMARLFGELRAFCKRIVTVRTAKGLRHV